jgi:hypothetical protein
MNNVKHLSGVRILGTEEVGMVMNIVNIKRYLFGALTAERQD